ncbi:MAG: Uncharacterized protein XD88_0774 [Methanocalculus sp. 52_23]|nr:MAG: Uncharacterized protein XD88_0774 [Methanocalculus sp. 52_23]
MAPKLPTTLDEIRKAIRTSNEVSFTRNRNQYTVQEQATLAELWECVPCTCDDDCTCKRFRCTFHWKIREGLTFTDVLPGYLRMFVDKGKHNLLLKLLDSQTPDLPRLSRRDKGAYDVLAWCRDIWDTIYPQAAAYNRTLLCDDWAPSFWQERWQFPIGPPVYKAKMMSLLVPDTAVPYDTASLTSLRGMFGLSPGQHYNVLLRNLRQYCIGVLDGEGVGLDDFRRLDVPGEVGTFHTDLITWPRPRFVYGTRFLPLERPLSRIVDKIFYQPG